MVAEKKTATKSSNRKKIPDYLIREMIDGQPLYYKGYKDVLNKKKTLEDIMGSSSLQAILISYLMEIIIEGKLKRKYEVLISEAGLHLDNRNNLAGDILIYDPAVLTADKISVHYADVPPKVNIEVDVMIDLENIKDYVYIQKKIDKLHQFGTEKVIWVLTSTRQVIVALPNKPWLTYDWNENIEIMDGVEFNVGEYLKKKGVQLPD
jgi:hypothetical protein